MNAQATPIVKKPTKTPHPAFTDAASTIKPLPPAKTDDIDIGVLNDVGDMMSQTKLMLMGISTLLANARPNEVISCEQMNALLEPVERQISVMDELLEAELND